VFQRGVEKSSVRLCRSEMGFGRVRFAMVAPCLQSDYFRVACNPRAIVALSSCILYFSISEVQFRTTANGAAFGSSTFVLIKNLWPSALTS
jgi:hypothetical protein